MKIKRLKLRNYKRFIHFQEFTFVNSDNEINTATLFLGDNGKGKSSILQAIALLLATVIRDDFDPDALDWPGFEYRNIQSGRMPLKIEATIIFSDEELDATQKYANLLQDKGIHLGAPNHKNEVDIFFDYEQRKTVTKGDESIHYQFGGYRSAKRLARHQPNIHELFENVGNVYWYNEQRNSNNITNLLEDKTSQLDDIRSFLANAYSFHIAVQDGKREMKEGEFDFYDKISKLYKKVFPERDLVGPAPRFDIYEQAQAPDFFLADSHTQYELSGMSAGERAIFPILMDFARWNINHSIILIDELELHLHPTLQQKLASTLTELGHDNQFFFTTHSDNIVTEFSEDENEIIRLDEE